MDQDCELLSIQCQLTTSAVVANRRVRIQIKDAAGRRVFYAGFAGDQAASLVYNYTMCAGCSHNALGTTVLTQSTTTPVGMRLQTGWTISTSTVAIDVGDTYDGLRVAILK
jgi:glycerol kinase